MIKNDKWIKEQAKLGMINPFIDTSIRKWGTFPVMSYGCSSFGYDIRLSSVDFRYFKHLPGQIVDPKNFNPSHLEEAQLHDDRTGKYFILPAHTYGLGVAVERLVIPNNITVLCIGKSSYARAGIIANLTPAESGWVGHLTLEFSNSSSADCKLYADEGIAQLLFFEGQDCEVTYNDRVGKYQNQPETVIYSKV